MTAVDQTPLQREPLIIGHRGASAKAPENTLAAFQMALDAGSDGIEFDVHLTRDGVPVVIHDNNLKRTGGRNQRITDLSLAELKEIDVGSWFSPSFSRERVPTLDEVFQLFEASDHLLYLEMKGNPDQRYQLAKTCCDYLSRSFLKDRVVIECFDLQGINFVKDIDSEIKTAALFEPGVRTTLSFGNKIIEQALAVRADHIALHHRLASVRTIEAARSTNLVVAVWTVDDPAWVKRATADGVFALITNDPESLVRQREIEGRAAIRVE